MWISEPISYEGPHLSDADAVIPLLAAAARMGASDVSFATDDPVLINHKASWSSKTSYRLNGSQVERLLKKLTNNDSVTSKVASGTDFDKAISIPDPELLDDDGEPVQHRFRLNITRCYAGTGLGFHAILRTIAQEPQTLDWVGFPDSLRERFAIRQGAFIIAGPVGSGKSTTFAACIRHILENDTPIKGAIYTYEAPVEYLFHRVQSRHSFVKQTEIGEHLPTFASGVRNALRRAVDLAVVGEMRDLETIDAGIQFSLTGRPLFATTHGNSSLEIISRLMEPFPIGQRHQRYATIVNASRLFMSQSLVPDRDGELVCLRDWLYLTNSDRERLVREGPDAHLPILRELIQNPENGSSMKLAIDEVYDQGRFTQPQRDILYAQYGVET